MNNLNYPAVVPVEMPVGLTHLDSDLCWCDPIDGNAPNTIYSPFKHHACRWLRETPQIKASDLS
jgi:hypothetical protein